MKRGLHHPGQADHGPDQPRSAHRIARQCHDTAIQLETNLVAGMPITRLEVDAIARLLGEDLAKLLDAADEQ